MNTFHHPPFPFLVGDRVHLQETPFCPAAMGTVLALDTSTSAPSAKVQWDDGNFSFWNTIALAPLLYGPAVLLTETWKQLSPSYRGVITREDISQGYRSALINLGGTVLCPVVTVPESLSFTLGGNQFLALSCVAVDTHHYVLLNYTPDANQHGDWAVIQVRLVDDGIVDAGDRQYFQTWQAAYRAFAQVQSSFASTVAASLQRLEAMAKERALTVRLAVDGYDLDYGGGFVSKFRFGEETGLEGLLSVLRPRETALIASLE